MISGSIGRSGIKTQQYNLRYKKSQQQIYQVTKIQKRDDCPFDKEMALTQRIRVKP